MLTEAVLMSSTVTNPALPKSSPCRPPARVNDRNRGTYSFVLSAVTASPRGWKCRERSGSFAALFRKSTWPTIVRVEALITVRVSCALLATKIRRPSGEQTMFHGSALVVSVPDTLAENVPQAGSAIRIIDTDPPAAFATYAY